MRDIEDSDSYSLFELEDAPDDSGPEASEDKSAEPDPVAGLEALSATVFLTGGTGLIGSHTAALFREMGWQVRALVRPSSQASFLEELGCQLVLGDLTSSNSISGAAEGCEAVVHSAAQLGTPAGLDRHVDVNVEGTRRVLKEAIDSGVPRFVHISSVAVYGAPFAEESGIDEEASLEYPIPQDDFYSLTKRMAEEVVRKAGKRIEWCILRPDMVMGERDRLFTPRVIRWASRPVLASLGGGGSDLPLVYAGSVALAAWLAATHASAPWKAYNVTDDGQLTQKTLVRVAAGRGSDAPVLPLPIPAMKLITRVSKVLAGLLPGQRRPILTEGRLRLFTEGDPYAGGRIFDELGWKPAVSTEEGWQRAVDWYRKSVSTTETTEPL
jgi:nucleoside-diphosphate-sugar epimerase